jgi:hypothetical protein
MTSSRNHKTGLTALAAAGVLDFSTLFALGTEDSAPVTVIVLTCVLGAVTIVCVAAAWRGVRTGLLGAVTARVLDSALGIPAFFLDAPAWVLTVITSMILLTIAGVALTAPELRRARVQAA